MINIECAEEPARLVDARYQVRKNSSLMNVTIALAVEDVVVPFGQR